MLALLSGAPALQPLRTLDAPDTMLRHASDHKVILLHSCGKYCLLMLPNYRSGSRWYLSCGCAAAVVLVVLVELQIYLKKSTSYHLFLLHAFHSVLSETFSWWYRQEDCRLRNTPLVKLCISSVCSAGCCGCAFDAYLGGSVVYSNTQEEAGL